MGGSLNFLSRGAIGVGVLVLILASAATAQPTVKGQPENTLKAAGENASQASPAGVLPTLDLKKSAINVTFKRMKLPITGFFKNFSGDVVFDPEKPAAGHANINVDAGSFLLRDTKLTREVRGADWLDVAQFPDARFVSSAIVTAGDGKYSVAGKLTLHGKTLNVVVPVSYTQAGHIQVFDGVLPISRQQFRVGPKSLLVADNVVIKLHLVSMPLP